MIDDQIALHKKSQEKGFPHEKSNLELNYKILETRRSKYLKVSFFWMDPAKIQKSLFHFASFLALALSQQELFMFWFK